MRFLFLVYSVVLVPVCLQQEISSTDIQQATFSQETPVASVNYWASLHRKKRKIYSFKVGSSLGFKQTAVNAIFGSGRGTRPPPPAATTTEVPQFDRIRVKLDVPGDLILIGYRITSSISKIIGSVFLNTAERKQRLVEAAKPFMAAKLGLDISASSFTTTEPIESLVPRLGPPLGGESAGSSATSTGDSSVNRTDRSRLRAL
ncbi:uncharacterized protein LOC126252795 [Schistocerca nitens]|uniref:uncharacterized protein LOC126252795 n=1 Tax=Schistocerca nitens TaxID=7011 RepID=UPI0021186B8C|nr:uncharacterized protein LOC126252795 [Schistocerca nitens]